MISRRTFLGWCGAATLASAFPIEPEFPDAPVWARALTAAEIYQRPAANAEVVGRLWPDSVVALQDVAEDWYATREGYLHREDAQPMLPLVGVASLTGPGWACVCAPIAPLRAWAAADAPLVERVGYGGVMLVRDCLAGEGDWLAVAPDLQSELLGWTPADRWLAVIPPAAPDIHPVRRGLRLDRTTGTILVLEDGDEMLRLPVSVPAGAEPGRFRLECRALSSAALLPGAAWVLRAGPALVYGVHWHNRFGRMGAGAGWEVPSALARWLYGWLPAGGWLEVV